MASGPARACLLWAILPSRSSLSPPTRLGTQQQFGQNIVLSKAYANLRASFAQAFLLSHHISHSFNRYLKNELNASQSEQRRTAAKQKAAVFVAIKSTSDVCILTILKIYVQRDIDKAGLPCVSRHDKRREISSNGLSKKMFMGEKRSARKK